MKISIKNNSFDPPSLALHIQRYIDNTSRFTAEVSLVGKTVIKIRNIRLRESRKYCGNHPNECEFPGAPLRKAKYLEGADWVDFNDMINDICDALAVDANIATAVCKVRKNKQRRVYYGSYMRGHFWQWNMDEPDEYYENWVHRPAPDSQYPFGTPGVYERNGQWTQEITRLRWQHGGICQSIAKYVVMNSEDFYWSESEGWISDFLDATKYSQSEVTVYNLPSDRDSRWILVGENMP